jgi:hypothetical protein
MSREEKKRTFVSIAGDRSDSRNSEVERIHRETSSLHEGDEERSEAAVDVETESMLEREFRESGNVCAEEEAVMSLTTPRRQSDEVTHHR